MFTGLILLSFLFGVATLLAMFLYPMRKRLRASWIWRMVVIFGAVGLLIPLIILVDSFATLRSYRWADLVWPSSIMLMAGEGDNRFSTRLFVSSMAVLSNVGLYGFLGLMVGSAITGVRSKISNSSGDELNK